MSKVIQLARRYFGPLVFFLGVLSVPQIVFCVTVDSYAFESFSINNPAFSRGTSAQINLNGDRIGSSDLVVLAYKYGVLGVNAGQPLRSLQGFDSNDSTSEARLLEMPLFYPNPFSMMSGGTLGYSLSKNMSVEVRVYDIRANEILRKSFVEAGDGGMSGYNKVLFNSATIGRYDLPAGIYFFVLMHEGRVLGRGKFAVKP